MCYKQGEVKVIEVKLLIDFHMTLTEGFQRDGMKEVKIGMIHLEDGRSHRPENVHIL